MPSRVGGAAPKCIALPSTRGGACVECRRKRGAPDALMCAGASLSFLSDTRARETRWAISSSIGVILENSAKDRDPGWFCLIYDCLVVRGAVRVDSCSLTVLFAHEKLIQVCATWSYIMDAANMAPPWWDAPCPLLHSVINSLARFCC